MWVSRVNCDSQIIKEQPMRDANRNVRPVEGQAAPLTNSAYFEVQLCGTGVAGTSTALCGAYLHTGHRALSERGLETFCTALRIQNYIFEEVKSKQMRQCLLPIGPNDLV